MRHRGRSNRRQVLTKDGEETTADRTRSSQEQRGKAGEACGQALQSPRFREMHTSGMDGNKSSGILSMGESGGEGLEKYQRKPGEGT